MALEGSLDTVSLPELLRLLSAGKSGRMVVDGERGPGALEVRHGRVVAAETERTGRIGDDGSPALAEGLFELLRSETGTFRFDPLEADESADEGAAAGTSPLAAVEELVDEATDLLARWRAVEVVVPSLLVAVDVAEAPPDGEATLDRARWPVLIAAARSATVADVGERLGLDEVRVSYAVRDLVDAGLVTIGPEREPEPVALAADPGVEPFVQEVPPAEAYEAAVAYDTAGSYERAEALNETYETLPATEPMDESELTALLEDHLPLDAAVADAAGEVAAAGPPAAGNAGDWADEEVLDQVFAEWVPGPPAEAHHLERDMLVIASDGDEEDDAGILERLLGSLRN